MCAAVGMRIYPDFQAAVRAMSRVDKVFYPNVARADFYQRLYQHIYKPWTKSLAQLYANERTHL